MKIQGGLRVSSIHAAAVTDVPQGCPSVKEYVLVQGTVISAGGNEHLFPLAIQFTLKRVDGRTPVEVGQQLRITIDDEGEVT